MRSGEVWSSGVVVVGVYVESEGKCRIAPEKEKPKGKLKLKEEKSLTAGGGGEKWVPGEGVTQENLFIASQTGVARAFDVGE